MGPPGTYDPTLGRQSSSTGHQGSFVRGDISSRQEGFIGVLREKGSQSSPGAGGVGRRAMTRDQGTPQDGTPSGFPRPRACLHLHLGFFQPKVHIHPLFSGFWSRWCLSLSVYEGASPRPLRIQGLCTTCQVRLCPHAMTCLGPLWPAQPVLPGLHGEDTRWAWGSNPCEGKGVCGHTPNTAWLLAFRT